jgi:cell division protein FtsX
VHDLRQVGGFLWFFLVVGSMFLISFGGGVHVARLVWWWGPCCSSLLVVGSMLLISFGGHQYQQKQQLPFNSTQ